MDNSIQVKFVNKKSPSMLVGSSQMISIPRKGESVMIKDTGTYVVFDVHWIFEIGKPISVKVILKESL